MARLLAVVGPTGVGKSHRALLLAQRFNGEIINGDSRQVYHYMDIGTAKPSRKELSQVPHHLVDIITPDEPFNVALYQELAYKTITDIDKRGKLAILVGGSGQYIWSVIEGWRIPKVLPDAELRRALEERARSGDGEGLYQELARADSAAAQRIGRHNLRRIIRALEIRQEASDAAPPQAKSPQFDTVITGLTMDRKALYRQVDRRVEQMMARGLVAEVEKLLTMGYHLDLPAMSSIGYRQIGLFLQGRLTLEEAVQQMKYETHRFIRNQYSWFRLKDARISWYHNDEEAAVTSRVADFLAE